MSQHLSYHCPQPNSKCHLAFDQLPPGSTAHPGSIPTPNLPHSIGYPRDTHPGADPLILHLPAPVTCNRKCLITAASTSVPLKAERVPPTHSAISPTIPGHTTLLARVWGEEHRNGGTEAWRCCPQRGRETYFLKSLLKRFSFYSHCLFSETYHPGTQGLISGHRIYREAFRKVTHPGYHRQWDRTQAPGC